MDVKRKKREDKREQQKFLHSLKAHKQVYAGKSKTLPKGATHRIETKPGGTKVLVRKRFSAV